MVAEAGVVATMAAVHLAAAAVGCAVERVAAEMAAVGSPAHRWRGCNAG